MIRKVSIGVRLGLVLGFAITMLLVIGITGVTRLGNLNEETNTIVTHRVPSLEAVNEVYSNFLLMRVNTANLMSARSLEEQENYNDAYFRAEQAMETASTEYDGLIEAAVARELFEQTLQSISDYQSLAQSLREMMVENRISESIDMLDTQVAPAARAVTDSIERLVDFQRQRIDEAAEATDAYYEESRTTSIIAMVVVTLIVIFAAWQLAISITRPMRKAVVAANQIAENDLTADIHADGRDEATILLQAMGRMQGNLKDAINRIATSSDQLASSSEELNAVTDETNERLQEQSEQVEQAASAVTELTSAIEEVASNAAQTAKVSADAEEQTQVGLDQVKQTVSAIERLVTDIQENAESTDALAKRVQDVGAVLDVIRTIAEQTNLLALNAAIEAARAGEHGRGFAVVADEVRGLARRTAESTKEIEDIIVAIRGGSEQAVTSMKESQESASETLSIGLKAGEALEKIASYISSISDRNTSSASASEQQALVAREVDRNLLTLKEIATQTATGSEQTKAASLDLAKLAEGLNELVSRFKV